jgi:hypothetical protein
MIPSRVRPSRPVIVAALAVAALLSGTGVALAVTSSSPSALRTATKVGTAVAALSRSPSRCQIVLPLRGFQPPARVFATPGPLAPLGFAPLGFGPFGVGSLGAIHGQFVVSKPGGGYQTIDTQRGTVTAVSASSITVKSGDGYTKTYQVTRSTNVKAQRAGIGSVKTGQTVSVVATVTGSSATATQIVDLAALPKLPALPKLSKLSKLPEIFKSGSGHVLRIGSCARISISRSR